MAKKKSTLGLKQKPTAQQCSKAISRMVELEKYGADHYKLWAEFKRKCGPKRK